MFATEAQGGGVVRDVAVAGWRGVLPAVRQHERIQGEERQADAVSGAGTASGTFSIKSATALKDSKLPLKKWAWAIYLEMTSLKGVSSMKLHRDLGVTQKTAWFMLHRIREAFAEIATEFEGPVEVDETNVGGKRGNKPLSVRRELTGRGPVDMTKVIGMKDRKTNRVVVKVIDDGSAASLHAFVNAHRQKGARVYTDDARGYIGLDNHESVNHTVGEYVREMAHTNGIESFWSMLKRGYTGVYHRMSVKHLERYAVQFAGRHNVRDMDTVDQMQHVMAGLVGRRSDVQRPD